MFLVQAHNELPGQASNIVTFISQPPSNQMSLFPTYLITVLIYGIISYQTQNLPQLKLWHSGPLHLAYEGFVFWVTFYFLTAPARPLSPCHTHPKICKPYVPRAGSPCYILVPRAASPGYIFVHRAGSPRYSFVTRAVSPKIPSCTWGFQPLVRFST